MVRQIPRIISIRVPTYRLTATQEYMSPFRQEEDFYKKNVQFTYPPAFFEKPYNNTSVYPYFHLHCGATKLMLFLTATLLQPLYLQNITGRSAVGNMKTEAEHAMHDGSRTPTTSPYNVKSSTAGCVLEYRV